MAYIQFNNVVKTLHTATQAAKAALRRNISEDDFEQMSDSERIQVLNKYLRKELINGFTIMVGWTPKPDAGIVERVDTIVEYLTTSYKTSGIADEDATNFEDSSKETKRKVFAVAAGLASLLSELHDYMQELPSTGVDG